MVWTENNSQGKVVRSRVTGKTLRYLKSFNDETGEAEFYAKIIFNGAAPMYEFKTALDEHEEAVTFRCFLPVGAYKVEDQ